MTNASGTGRADIRRLEEAGGIAFGANIRHTGRG